MQSIHYQIKMKLFMESHSIFVDTSFFKALVDKRDDNNEQAEKIWKKLQKTQPSFITSNYILDESYGK